MPSILPSATQKCFSTPFGVDPVYPNTKWRMLDDVFLMLATSTETADHRLLFKVLEELCHPLRFAGDTQRAQEMQDFVTDLICYDHYYFVGTIIKKVGSEKDDWIVIAMVNEGREKRKKERGQKSAEGIAAMSQLFDQYTNRADEVRAESTQAHQPQSAHPPHPINIVIHNQNVQHTQPHDSSEKAAPNMSYKFHELHVELGHHILRNTANNMTKDLTGFNYHLLRLLLAADGNLVSYQAIADAVRNDTVGKLDEKDVMDRKSAFIRMLKEQLKISGSTADRLIEGKGGYRINRMVYEQSTKAF